MKNILIRAGLTALEVLPPEQILCDNLIGSNVGNLIYAYAVQRTLMVDSETEITANRYVFDDKEAEFINENYDALIIPLADMFRSNGVAHMKEMTRLVKKLRIPCVVIGVGIRAPLGYDIDEGFDYDPVVKEFVDAVLEKSSMIGLRGEITGRYLNHLGYKEDQDYMVIGCPSMYGCGGVLGRKPLTLNKDSRIAVNSSVLAFPDSLRLIDNVMNEYKNSWFYPQRQDEFWMLYGGVPYVHKQKEIVYPDSLDARVYKENRVKFFLSAKAWINDLSKMDISVGGRLHGNVAAIQAGIPCIMMPHDSRMKELADYHKFPHIMSENVKADDTIESLLERVDMDTMYKQHGENFNRYRYFLDKNGIDHIYKNADVVENAPMDVKLQNIVLPDRLKTVLEISKDELMERWVDIHKYGNKKLKKKYKTLKKKNEQLERKYKAINKTSITTDARLLKMKVGDRNKNVKATNYQRLERLNKGGK